MNKLMVAVFILLGIVALFYVGQRVGLIQTGYTNIESGFVLVDAVAFENGRDVGTFGSRCAEVSETNEFEKIRSSLSACRTAIIGGVIPSYESSSAFVTECYYPLTNKPYLVYRTEGACFNSLTNKPYDACDTAKYRISVGEVVYDGVNEDCVEETTPTEDLTADTPSTCYRPDTSEYFCYADDSGAGGCSPTNHGYATMSECEANLLPNPTECSTSSECTAGYECKSNFCVAIPDTPPLSPLPTLKSEGQSCSTTTDCISGLKCEANIRGVDVCTKPITTSGGDDNTLLIVVILSIFALIGIIIGGAYLLKK